MPTRKLLMLIAPVVAIFVVGFASPAISEESKSKKARPSTLTGGTAKAGETCKVDNDCDQSGREMLCRRSKCEYDVSKIPAKT